MRHSLQDLAAALGAELLGDGSLQVVRIAEPASAGPEDLALAIAPKFAAQLKDSSARAAVVWAGADLDELGLEGAIVAPGGRLALVADDGAFPPIQITEAMDFEVWGVVTHVIRSVR